MNTSKSEEEPQKTKEKEKEFYFYGSWSPEIMHNKMKIKEKWSEKNQKWNMVEPKKNKRNILYEIDL